MKKLRKIFAFMLAFAMTLALSGISAFADTTGTITISNASQGQTYKIYKIFDATYNETTETTAYSVKDGDIKTAAATENSPFTVSATANTNGDFAVTLKEDKSVEDVVDWINDNFAIKNTDQEITGYKLTEAGSQTLASGNTVTFDVSYGYYFVTSSLGTTVTIDTNTPDVNVIDKNITKPDIPDDPDNPDNHVKAIVIQDGDTTTETLSTTAQIGDEVSFKIKFKATNFVTENDATGKAVSKQIHYYTIEDIPDGIAIDVNTLEVMVGTQDITDTVKTATGTNIATNGFTLRLPWVTQDGEVYTSIYNSPIDVVVTYKATVTEAVAQKEDGKATNVADIDYYGLNDEPLNPDDPDPTPTEVETYSFDLVKTDQDNTILIGAEFSLWDAENGGEKIQVVKENGFYRIAKEGETGVPIEAGNVTIKGLNGEKTYYLQEDVAPAGYNKLSTRTMVQMNNSNIDAEVADNTYRQGGVQVINQTGAELPSTGGMGTTIFYVIGGILVVGAGILLVVKRRMRGQL